MNGRELQQMYQQWCQGNEDYNFRWLDFVEMAARQFKQPESEVLRELQKHYWFVKNIFNFGQKKITVSLWNFSYIVFGAIGLFLIVFLFVMRTDK